MTVDAVKCVNCGVKQEWGVVEPAIQAALAQALRGWGAKCVVIGGDSVKWYGVISPGTSTSFWATVVLQEATLPLGAEEMHVSGLRALGLPAHLFAAGGALKCVH